MPDADLGLDRGETAAILLAEAIEADLLLLDERAGRAVALEAESWVKPSAPTRARRWRCSADTARG